MIVFDICRMIYANYRNMTAKQYQRRGARNRKITRCLPRRMILFELHIPIALNPIKIFLDFTRDSSYNKGVTESEVKTCRQELEGQR